MIALLAFLGALVALVVVAAVVNRMRGIRAQYVEDWQPAAGDDRLLDDPGADFYVVPKLGQAKVMTFARQGRAHAVLSDTRIVIGQRALLSRRHMITHILLLKPDAADAGELDRMTGGQYTKGYVVMETSRDRMTVEADGAKTYLRIVPAPTASATNVSHCRLYSRMAALFLESA